MRKERTPVTPTPQRFSWSDHAVASTYQEANNIRDNLKQPHKKIRLQRGKFHVKVGTVVKQTAAAPVAPVAEE